MLIDGRTIPAGTTVGCDVCIVGGGAAGLTLALEFIGQNFKVCLLESGGQNYEESTQALYQGESVGHPYFPLDSARLRYLGGTTNHWGGTCRPLDEIDFEVRDYLPHSGWPFPKTQLMPFYERAQKVCQLGPFDYRPSTWASKERPLLSFDDDVLRSGIYQYSPPTRFGAVYGQTVASAPNIDLYLHANVLELEMAASGNTVASARVSSLEKNVFRVTSKVFIVACGGIENPRLLLLSSSRYPQGLGNQHDLVGRYFMEHPITDSRWKSTLLATSDVPLMFYDRHSHITIPESSGAGSTTLTISGMVKPTKDTMRRERLLNCAIRFRQLQFSDASAGTKAVKQIADSLERGEFPDNFWDQLADVVTDLDDVAVAGYEKLRGWRLFAVDYHAEPAPNPDSRVSLSDELDAFGQRRVKLDWELSSVDHRNIGRYFEILGAEFGRMGLGRVHLDPIIETANWDQTLTGSWHHMGTTRMDTDPAKGVVDPNCTVHGIPNLHVAGSSVFPTVGHSNPTLTICALAIRLADHVKAQLA